MFSFEEDLNNRADWTLLRNGVVSLFWNMDVLDEAERALSELGYDIARIFCAKGWGSFERQLSDALLWEEQFGYAPWNGNLDALNDGMRGYPFGPSKRAALVLTGFNTLVDRDAQVSHIILDILESNARDFLLFGMTLITLVQTDDSRFDCPEIGGRRPRWNNREWTARDRGL